MIKSIIFMIAICSIILLIFNSYFYVKTSKLIAKHQAEWDKIKSTLDEHEVFDVYMEYCKHLMMTQHPIVGACFPRM